MGLYEQWVFASLYKFLRALLLESHVANSVTGVL